MEGCDQLGGEQLLEFGTGKPLDAFKMGRYLIGLFTDARDDFIYLFI